MSVLHIDSSSGGYGVTIANGALAGVGSHPLAGGRHAVVITTRPVLALWGQVLLGSFPAEAQPIVLLHRDGERAKSARSWAALLSGLAAAGARRDSIVLAMGGGVTGDLAGFVAATYMRGIDVMQIPTTLLAQVDSSIGGKTGIDLPEGKNLAGSFHSPVAVVTDPRVLGTLSAREFRAGMYECIKSAILGDAALFEFLESRREAILAREMDVLEQIILRTAAVKARLVGADEYERGDRALLNLGHTFAHGLETALQYRVLKHGEAVAWGMLAAIALSEQLCGLGRAEAGRMTALIHSYGRLPRFSIPAKAVTQAMARDKKHVSGTQRFILTRGIGQAHIAAVEDADAQRVLEQLLAEAAR